ncbi:MAG: DUF4465 domain-containing protein [Alistipes sp.]|nr:DUF4465 domain-containing protein [Alistipes sp.]
MAGCSKEDSTTDVAPATFTLTGYTSNDTRTAFGTPDENTIPFVWSEGDKIWSDSEQSNAAVINGDGSASFTFASEPESTIYYNMKGTSAAQANVPAEQSIANNLGQNGDFGYAAVEDGTFTLLHATAYLWFNTTTSIANATLNTITINADGVNIAGKATWSDSSFGAVSEGKSEVTLTVNQPLSSTNGNVWAMVVLPADLSDKNIKVTYELSIGGNTKYHIQTLAGKNIEAGKTQKISTTITNENIQAYRELRVLTFEDSDAKFPQYTLDYCSKEINKWSDLIVAEDEQAYGAGSTLIYDEVNHLAEYQWQDKNNTGLYHKFPYNWGGYSFSGGSAVISSHTTTMEQLNEASDIYYYQLSICTSGGHNSSSNFCVVYNDSAVNTTAKSELSFPDGVARVIDHMYVTMTAVTQYCVTYGNDFSGAYDEDDYLNIVATGYNGETETGKVTFELAQGADKKVTDWTKWDLSSLGKVTKVTFHMEEAQIDDYGYAQYYKTPMFFAFDDVAVQF